MRGIHVRACKAWRDGRFIPADAGNTNSLQQRDYLFIGSSPRMRGIRQILRVIRQQNRFIPADAGNTSPSAAGQQRRRFIPADAGNTCGVRCGTRSK